MNKVKVSFIGHFSRRCEIGCYGVSVAGNQVQREVYSELIKNCNVEVAHSYVMTPNPTWPTGPFRVNSSIEDDCSYIGYINLPIIKHICFSVVFILNLIKDKPDLCVQYNSYFFENLFLLIYRFFNKGTKLAIIIQDIHVGSFVSFRSAMRSLSERLSIKLASFFDIIIPISDVIQKDFSFSSGKCFVFQGGVTEFSLNLDQYDCPTSVVPFGVFAGALEPHNGVDQLVINWAKNNFPYKLHVFGRGSLSHFIENLAINSPNVVFHGFKTEEVILSWQKESTWNFCFRFSYGIDQRYFFPSKFFSLLCAPGIVVVNNFYGFPSHFLNTVFVVKDDFENLIEVVENSEKYNLPSNVDLRRNLVKKNHTWGACVANVISKTIALRAI